MLLSYFSAVASLAIAVAGGSSALGAGLKPDSKVARNVLEGKAEGYCSPSGPIDSTNCAHEQLEVLNKELYPSLQKLVRFPFFRHYKVDLFRECAFWNENGFCMLRDCSVEAADESEIPEKWRSRALGQVRQSSSALDVDGCYYREQDFCYIEDDATDSGEYIDLTLNPERFTGYAGESAHHVWRAIYEENCFGLSEASLESDKIAASGSSLLSANPFGRLSEGLGTEMVKSAAADDNDMCEEKRIYYRVISGLHASISIHICNEYLDQATGEWAPNLQCFITRLASHPERLSNVYFNAVLLLRAVARAAPYLEAYDIGVAPVPCNKKALIEEDESAKQTLRSVLDLARGDTMDKSFDEAALFNGRDSVILKDQFKSHFRNVSRIMDCVGCDKCRLWGKLQVSGIGTAMKILFELEEKALDPKVNPNLLQRSEVVALFNTLHRVSESLEAVETFRRMYAETQAQEVQRVIQRVTPRTDKSAAGWLAGTLAFALSALEATRRMCKGCLELGWKHLRGLSSRPRPEL